MGIGTKLVNGARFVFKAVTAATVGVLLAYGPEGVKHSYGMTKTLLDATFRKDKVREDINETLEALRELKDLQLKITVSNPEGNEDAQKTQPPTFIENEKTVGYHIARIKEKIGLSWNDLKEAATMTKELAQHLRVQLEGAEQVKANIDNSAAIKRLDNFVTMAAKTAEMPVKRGVLFFAGLFGGAMLFDELIPRAADAPEPAVIRQS